MASTTPPKVPVYSGNETYKQTYNKLTIYKPPDLKSTTDDAIAPYLTTLPRPYTFAQDHTRTNVRFALGYTAVAIAAFTFYADRKLGWEATQSPWIIAAVASYFVLNSALTCWVWGVEAGEVFRGRREGGETISIRSSVKKYTPFYKITVLYKDAAGKVLQEKETQATFMTWFAGNGVFHPEPFRRWLANEIEVLGLAAKKNEDKTGGASALVGDLSLEETKGAKRR